MQFPNGLELDVFQLWVLGKEAMGGMSRCHVLPVEQVGRAASREQARLDRRASGDGGLSPPHERHVPALKTHPRVPWFPGTACRCRAPQHRGAPAAGGAAVSWESASQPASARIDARRPRPVVHPRTLPTWRLFTPSQPIQASTIFLRTLHSSDWSSGHSKQGSPRSRSTMHWKCARTFNL